MGAIVMGDEPVSRTTTIIVTIIGVVILIVFAYACAKGAMIV